MRQKQSTGGSAAALAPRLRQIRDTLCSGLIQRDIPVRLALLAALTGEHLLLIGPPGTAKSLLARRLQLAFRDVRYFERLLTRFTVPEELFGPLSIKGLEEDRYERLVESYLPAASVAFLDEIFKANSAILNSLLTLLNEREFDNGAKRIRTPLITVVGASNELPEGEELTALFDRFLLRLYVGPLDEAGFKALLDLGGDATADVPTPLQLTHAELSALRDEAQRVTLGDDMRALLVALRSSCAEHQIAVSDRRWRKVVALLKMSAWTNGRDAVSPWDGWLLQHCLWERPEEREKIYEWYERRVGTTSSPAGDGMSRIVVAWEARLKRDEDAQSQRTNKEGELLYQGPDGKPTTARQGRMRKSRAGEPLFLAPPFISDRTNAGRGYTLEELDNLQTPTTISYGRRETFREWSGRDKYIDDPRNHFVDENHQLPPLNEATRHKAAYIKDVHRQLGEHRAELNRHLEGLKQQLTSLTSDITTHLWVPQEFAAPATAALKQAIRDAKALVERLAAVDRRYDELPQERDELVVTAGQAKNR